MGDFTIEDIQTALDAARLDNNTQAVQELETALLQMQSSSQKNTSTATIDGYSVTEIEQAIKDAESEGNTQVVQELTTVLQKGLENNQAAEQKVDEKSVKGFTRNVAKGVGNVIAGIANMAAHPIDSIEGIADLGVTALTGAGSDTVNDMLFGYEKDPTSVQYKINDWLKKNAPEWAQGLLVTKDRAQYEQMAGILKNEIKKAADDPLTFLYENPVESLLTVSGAGNALSAPMKAQKLSSTLSGAGNILEKGSKAIDPLQWIGKGFEKAATPVKNKAELLKQANAVNDAKTANGIKYGFKVTPSEVKAPANKNIIAKGLEKLTGGETLAKTQQYNLTNAEKLIRKHANVSEGTPLASIYEKISNRSKRAYADISKLKGKTKPAIKTTTETYQQKQPRRGQPDRTVERQNVKETPTKTIQYESGKSLLAKIEKQKSQNKKDFISSRKENSKIDQNKLDANANKLEALHIKLKQTINYNKTLAQKKGASARELAKFDKMIANLDKARKDYAIGHSIENALNPDGSFNIQKYANQNRNNVAVTGEGRAIIDFADANPNLVKKSGSSAQTTFGSLVDLFGKYKFPIIGFGLSSGNVPLAASILGVQKATPSLLQSKIAQNQLLKNRYSGSSILNTGAKLQNISPEAVIIPSLLQSSRIEDIEYL